MRVTVHRRDGLNWIAFCAEHDDVIWCSDWESAMEAAWWHIAMRHHSRTRDHEYGFRPVGQPEENQCVDCGTPIPVWV